VLCVLPMVRSAGLSCETRGRAPEQRAVQGRRVMLYGGWLYTHRCAIPPSPSPWQIIEATKSLNPGKESVPYFPWNEPWKA
jgi:hypothetical protein